MRAVELLKALQGYESLLKSSGVSLADVRHLSLYDDFTKLNGEETKKTFIYAHLANKYGLCERQVRRIMSRLGKEI